MDAAVASFRRVDRPDGVCLIVAGELDESNREDLYEALIGLLDDARSPAVIDFTGVTFFNSTGIAALMSANARAAIRGVQLIIEPSWAVRRVLDITDLTREFDVRGTNERRGMRARARSQS